MRLKKIRLAGFKSFVDPTNIPFPDDMTAIVGPNGCGKSNVIDAVRWVLGESSAKNLRGDAMTDVIFNGSTGRKPVSQCSVELVFENASERLQGEFAKYDELSIKRVVTREAISTYYLNGTKCRRRDVTDLFLGTGLGPRSYAIIEQGMISRLVESKPQELRIFIEEAAGISKYKERRRETENRIRHTNENLDRLADVRGELGQQLEKLQRQAAAAKRYKDLKSEERNYKGQLAALRWLKYTDLIETLEKQIAEVENQLQSFIAEQRGSEKGMLSYQFKQQEFKQQLDDVQQQSFKLGNEITRLEQSQIHQKVRAQQITSELQSLHDNIVENESHNEQEQQLIEELHMQLEKAEPDHELSHQQLEQAQQALIESEQHFDQQQQQWRAQEQAQMQRQQQLQLLKNQLQSLHAMQLRTGQRLSELQQERLELDEPQLQQQLEDEQVKAQQAETQLSQFQQQQQQQLHALEQLQQSIKDAEASKLELIGQQQQLAAETASLNTLQASQNTGQELQQWLAEQQVEHQPLWQYLQVEAGWELAVETALQQWLQTQIVEDKMPLPAIAGARLLFAQSMTTQKPANSLAAKVQSQRVPTVLTQILLADSAEQAMSMRLSAEQSVISKDGFWCSAEWAMRAGQDQQASLMQRAKQIDSNQLQLAELASQITELQQQLENLNEQQQQAKSTLDNTQQQRQSAQDTLSQAKAQLHIVQQQQTQNQQRQQKIAGDIARQQQQVEEEALQQEEIAMQLEELEMSAESDDGESVHDIAIKRERCQQQISQHRQQLEQIKNRQHQHALQLQGVTSQLQSRQQALGRNQQLLQQMHERREALKTEQQDMLLPMEDHAEQLQIYLQQHLEMEQQKSQLQDELAEVESFLADNQKGQQAVVDKIHQLQTKQQSLQLECEGHRVRAKAVVEQLPDIDMGLKELLEEMPAEAEEREWQQRLEKSTAAIGRLGAVNLAAVEEFEVQSERKAHLDEQHQDLVDAMDTLEAAIRKIDKETRSRFKDTFNAVNADLQILFPKVFGGGAASLELTDDDLLETGVAIMAQPPGKKNSTIHLLSGGEKALTALSLVFAIFRLNPAPFCLLDEVDAPLDDANVVRFCKLVSEMSKSVQFIYISHNKIAMEMASHLTGVTMAEPGVSRMVAVDVEEAVALAEA
ncbi:chromosome segregation protein SMC [Alteromonadaceae bacterium BrNp21-10]|nr:chromosome segregation protein SMC [Alteromonadaceae bacterium BrNp21-10]